MLQLAVESDREAVNRLAKQVHSLHVSWRPDIYEMAGELYSEERFRKAVAQRQLYVATVGGLVAGYALLLIRNWDAPGLVKRRVLLIDELCVDEICRGQGIGTEMMEDIRALAKAFGCTDLQLGVYPQNEAAVAFYRKCGFSIHSIDLHSKV